MASLGFALACLPACAAPGGDLHHNSGFQRPRMRGWLCFSLQLHLPVKLA
jgi:hypothetical protein